MSEDCRTSHVCDSDLYDDGQANSGNVLSEIARTKASRRSFIKGVIASGATLGATGYLFRAGAARAVTTGTVERLVSLKVNGQIGASMCCRTRRWPTPFATSSD